MIDATGKDIRLEIDGGVKIDNIGEIAAAGVAAVPDAVRQGLSVESGLNDGICVPILLLFMVIATDSPAKGETALLALTLAAKAIGIGVAVGVAVGVMVGVAVAVGVGVTAGGTGVGVIVAVAAGAGVGQGPCRGVRGYDFHSLDPGADS